MDLSTHLSLQEFTQSDTAIAKGIDNSLPPELIEKAKKLAAFFEEIRELLAIPIHIDSGYRCKALNLAVRGVETSQHCLVEALDMVPQGMTINDTFKKIIDSNISFDQLIQEGGWCHASCKVDNPGANRGEILLTVDHKTYEHLTKAQALARL